MTNTKIDSATGKRRPLLPPSGRHLGHHHSLLTPDGVQYGLSRSFRRMSNSETQQWMVSALDIDCDNRWRKMERVGAKKVKFSIKDHYIVVVIVLESYLRHSQAQWEMIQASHLFQLSWSTRWFLWYLRGGLWYIYLTFEVVYYALHLSHVFNVIWTNNVWTIRIDVLWRTISFLIKGCSLVFFLETALFSYFVYIISRYNSIL